MKHHGQRPSRAVEHLVHHVGAGGDHGAQLVPVDDLGCAGTGVPGQAGDLLHRDPGLRHQADERVPQLPRRPATANAGLLTEPTKTAPNIRVVQRLTRTAGEHQAMILPQLARRQPGRCLPLALFSQRRYRTLRQSQGAPGPLGLRVAPGPPTATPPYAAAPRRQADSPARHDPSAAPALLPSGYLWSATRSRRHRGNHRPGHAQQRRRLVRGHGLGRTPGLARRRLDQRGDVAPHMIPGFSMPDGPHQAVVRQRHRRARSGRRQIRERPSNVVSAQRVQRDAPEQASTGRRIRSSRRSVLRDRPSRPSRIQSATAWSTV